MSDSEEFLSAEEDYDTHTTDDKPHSQTKEKNKWNEEKVLNDAKEKGNIELKAQKAINVEPLLTDKEINIKNELKTPLEESVNVNSTENDNKTNSQKLKLEDENELKSSKTEKVEDENLNFNKTLIVNTEVCDNKQKVKKSVSKSKETIEEIVNLKITDKKINENLQSLDVNKKPKKSIKKNKGKRGYIESVKDKSIESEIKPVKFSEHKDEENIVAEKNEDTWDFDDWGNDEKSVIDKDKEFVIEKKEEISKIDTKPKPIVSTKKPLDETKEDNWDFDNWGESKVGTKDSKDNEETGWDDFGDDEWIATDEIKKNMDSSAEDSFKQQKALKNNFSSNNKTASENQSQLPNVAESFETISQNFQNNTSWNGWKPWGGVVTSFLSTATEGVTSLTTHVSQVLESSIGIPEPEELVKINQKLEEKEKSSEFEKLNENKTQEKREEKPSTLIGIVSGVTTIGNKVIAGGLDTLEGIGKKTMNILQENDPLLLNKRRIIGLETSKPNLSQVLREAKEKSEEIEKNLKQAQKQSYKKQLHFETLFDHYYGLVHLEALEMLSKQCDIKLQSLMSPLSGKALEEMKDTLKEVKELCELDEAESEENDEPYTSESLENDLKIATQDFGIATDFSELIQCWRRNLVYLSENVEDPHDVFEKGLRCLAETCALQMNKMHKIAELLIIHEPHSTANEADSLVQITNIFSRHLKGIANKFCGKLNTFEQTEEVNASITNIFLEVYNSTSYVQSAFKLFIPILQVGAA